MSSDDSKGSIRVPDAPFRPGEEASFDSWPWKPGDFSMPDPKTCEFKDTTELANGLVRVLDDDGVASGNGTQDFLRRSCETVWSIWLGLGYSMIE
ncbi:MAG: hypothetical protein CM15mP105_2150 [Methanobacteriota archaeon]|nr:MAG: hypothetical protein CM15mP105_2150 [Euryarchaeota archaeon]